MTINWLSVAYGVLSAITYMGFMGIYAPLKEDPYYQTRVWPMRFFGVLQALVSPIAIFMVLWLSPGFNRGLKL